MVRVQRVIQRNYVKEGPEIGMDHFMAFSIFNVFEVMHTLACICMFFSVGFLNDETWLNVGSTRTLMKAPLCVET